MYAIRMGLVLACGLLLFAGCAPEKTCSTDAICGQGQICKEGLCVEGCTSNAECPASQPCVDSTCQADACQPGQRRACYEGNPNTKDRGTCAPGIQICDAKTKVWSACFQQQTPQPETCDRLDNDCNGQVDDGIDCTCKIGQKRACYSGPPDSQGRGPCAQGTQYCGEDLKWGKCLGQSIPLPEVCDEIDNDCNGKVDDLLDCTCAKGASRPCYTGPQGSKDKGPCKAGVQSCNRDNLWGPCLGQVLPASEEKSPCNGKDDDCDGIIDGPSCGSSEPSLEVSKEPSPEPQVQEKSSTEPGPEPQPEPAPEPRREATLEPDGGAPKEALGEPSFPDKKSEPMPEVATERVVEGSCSPGAQRFCYTGPAGTQNKGICSPGTQTCSGQRSWGPCVGQVTPKSVEECNGKDDDCNGMVDDGIAPISCGKGECDKKIFCQNGQQSKASCPKPSQELCYDGKDNDCDGQSDEGCLGCVPGLRFFTQSNGKPNGALAVSPDGKLALWSVGSDGLHLRAYPSGSYVRNYRGAAGAIRQLSYRADQKLFASAEDTATGGSIVRIWDVDPAKGQKILLSTKSPITALAFSSTGATLALSVEDQWSVQLWKPDSSGAYKLSNSFSAPLGPGGSACTSKAQCSPLELCYQSKCHAIQSGGAGHTGSIRAIAFDSQGKTLATAGDDQSVQIWDLSSLKRSAILAKAFPQAIVALAYSDDGKYLAAASSATTGDNVKVWSASSLQQVSAIQATSKAIAALGFGPASHQLLVTDGDVLLWDITSSTSPRLSHTFKSDWGGQLQNAALAVSGKRLLASSSLSEILAWDFPQKKLSLRFAPFNPHTGSQSLEISALAMHPTKPLLAVGTFEGWLVWIDASTGHLLRRQDIRRIKGPKALRISRLAFLPDGSRLVAFMDRTEFVLLDPSTYGVVKRIPTPHPTYKSGSLTLGDQVGGVAFRPDGKVMASVGLKDGALRLIDLAKGSATQIAGLRGHRVAWSPKGRYLSVSLAISVGTTQASGSAQLWDLQLSQKIGLSLPQPAVPAGYKKARRSAWGMEWLDEKTLAIGYLLEASTATGSSFGTVSYRAGEVKIWQIEPAVKVLRTFSTSGGGAIHIRRSPDGQLLYERLGNGQLQVRQLSTGKVCASCILRPASSYHPSVSSLNQGPFGLALRSDGTGAATTWFSELLLFGCGCTGAATRSCFHGDPSFVGKGLCKAGTQTCSDQAVWGACSGETRPVQEQADGADNDCDGIPDNEFVDLQIRRINLPASWTRGSNGVVQICVENVGTPQSVSMAFRVALYQSSDASLDAGDTPITASPSPLNFGPAKADGNQVCKSFNLPIPAGLAKGKYYVIGYVNLDKKAHEKAGANQNNESLGGQVDFR